MFEELKKKFIIELVLVTSDLNKEMRVKANISELLNEAQRNYEIYNKEILAIIRYLET